MTAADDSNTVQIQLFAWCSQKGCSRLIKLDNGFFCLRYRQQFHLFTEHKITSLNRQDFQNLGGYAVV